MLKFRNGETDVYALRATDIPILLPEGATKGFTVKITDEPGYGTTWFLINQDIGLAEGTVIILMAVLWFGVPLRGGLVPLYCGLFLYLLAVIGVGLMVSSISRTQQQAILGAFLFIVPAVILSGFATPIANIEARSRSRSTTPQSRCCQSSHHS